MQAELPLSENILGKADSSAQQFVVKTAQSGFT